MAKRKMTLQEFHDEIWWPRCQKKLRECTQTGYASAYRLHIAPYMKDMYLEDITPRYLDKWFKEGDIKASTWKIFKALIRVAYKFELIDKDPCDRVLDPPPRGTPNPPTLSRAEMQQMLDGLTDVPYYPALVCSATMGLRREESCGLRWEDFNWRTNIVHIQRGMQFVNGHIVIGPTKTVMSNRKLPMPKDCIVRLLPIRKEEGYIIGDLNPSQVAGRYRRACISRGLPYVPMSNLRTSWCTMLIGEGVPVSKVSRYMGHTDVSTTVRWYTKPREDELNDVAAAF